VITRGNKLKSRSVFLSRPAGEERGPTFIRQCYPNRRAFLRLAFRSIRRRRWIMGGLFRMCRTSSLSCMGTSSGSVLQTAHHASLSTKRALFCNLAVGYFSVFFLVTTMFPSYLLLETEPGDGKRVTTMALPSRPQVSSFHPLLFSLIPSPSPSILRPSPQCPIPLPL